MKKIVVTCLALVLAVVASITGTLAWLTAKTEEVTNTFTIGDIDITLIEHEYDENDTDSVKKVKKDDKDVEVVKTASSTQNYPLIPGTTYWKDPVVTISDSTNVDCYLFVKFENGSSQTQYLTFTSNLKSVKGPDGEETEWTQGDDTNIPINVWYREVKTTDSKKSWSLIDGNTVKVNENIIKGTPATGSNDIAMPSTDIVLKYTAYAVQKDNLTVQQAWEKVSAAS